MAMAAIVILTNNDPTRKKIIVNIPSGDESFFNVFKLKEGFRICVWLGPLFAFSMMMTISLINVITVCRTFAVVAPFYYKLYLR